MIFHRWAGCLFLAQAMAWAVAAPVHGQSLLGGPPELNREPILPRDFNWLSNRQLADLAPYNRSIRVPLFRMPSAYGNDGWWLDSQDELAAGNVDYSSTLWRDGDPGDNRVQVTMGADNPFFDFRKPGDPGGVGFYRVHSQFLLFDNESTGIGMGFRAVRPAGVEADGVADGPAFFSPNFTWFHEVSNGTAIQGFVGKNLRANSRWADGFHRSIQYGLALQSPCPGVDCRCDRGVHLFVEALGHYRPSTDPSGRPPANWELVPGLQWRLSETWWMSGGILMPVGSPRLENRLWQITCSWKF